MYGNKSELKQDPVDAFIEWANMSNIDDDGEIFINPVQMSGYVPPEKEIKTEVNRFGRLLWEKIRGR